MANKTPKATVQDLINLHVVPNYPMPAGTTLTTYMNIDTLVVAPPTNDDKILTSMLVFLSNIRRAELSTIGQTLSNAQTKSLVGDFKDYLTTIKANIDAVLTDITTYYGTLP